MMMASAAELEVKPPTVFSPRAVMAICLWGVILVLPVVVAMMFVSVLHFGVLTFFIPLATIAVATFFLPLGFGNPYVGRLARRLQPRSEQGQDVFLVQLTRRPRMRSGFMALLEDADDIGFLSFCESYLAFHGDSVRLKVPYDKIRRLQLRNAGWRALFAYGSQTVFEIRGMADAGTFGFAERASWHLPGSRKNAREMYLRLAQKTQA